MEKSRILVVKIFLFRGWSLRSCSKLTSFIFSRFTEVRTPIFSIITCITLYKFLVYWVRQQHLKGKIRMSKQCNNILIPFLYPPLNYCKVNQNLEFWCNIHKQHMDLVVETKMLQVSGCILITLSSTNTHPHEKQRDDELIVIYFI